MGLIDHLWNGAGVDSEGEFHESTLAALLVADALQRGSQADRRWKVAAVYRGVQMLADLIAELPWHTFDGGANDGLQLDRPPLRRVAMPALLVRPDPFLTRSDFLREIVLSLIWNGNALVAASRLDAAGTPLSVRVLPWAEVTVEWNPSRTRRIYTHRLTPLSSELVQHLALNRRAGELVGVGPLDAFADGIAGHVSADRFARELFDADGIPSGKLTHPGKLTQPEAKEILAVWREGQAEGRKTALVSGGIDYEPIGLSPDEGQLLQSRSFAVAEIARLLGIPAHLLQAAIGVAGSSGSSLTYTNVQQIQGELVRQTIHPTYLARIEEMASSWLPRGQSVMFDLTEYLRADDRTRFESHAVALGSGFATINEVRRAEGRPPLPGGDTVAGPEPEPDPEPEVAREDATT